jgi:hypothetical protein
MACRIFCAPTIPRKPLDNLAARFYSLGVPRDDRPSQELRELLRKIGSKGGKARAKKYDTKTFRKWAKESGAGRPRKRKKEGL